MGCGRTVGTVSPRRISRAGDAIAWANWCRSTARSTPGSRTAVRRPAVSSLLCTSGDISTLRRHNVRAMLRTGIVAELGRLRPTRVVDRTTMPGKAILRTSGCLSRKASSLSCRWWFGSKGAMPRRRSAGDDDVRRTVGGSAERPRRTERPELTKRPFLSHKRTKEERAWPLFQRSPAFTDRGITKGDLALGDPCKRPDKPHRIDFL